MPAPPFLRFPVLIACCCLGIGCSSVRTEDSPFFREDVFRADPPRTLAIAPFENATGVADAAPKLRRAVYGALAGLDYTDVELSRVDQAVSQRAMQLNVPPDEVPPQEIAIPDLADAVVFGRVEHVSRLFLFIYGQYRIDVSLALYDTDTRQQLYVNRYVVRNRRWTIPTSPLGIGQSLLQTLWFMRGTELEKSFGEVAQEIAVRFPKPPAQVGEKGLFIDRVQVDVARESLREGDRVLVRVDGSPGKQASFSLGPRVVDQPLRETTPGQYGGLYVIRKGDDARYVYVRVRLQNPDDGNDFVELDAHDQHIRIDTQPPVAFAVHTWARLPGARGIAITFGPEDRTSPAVDDVPVAFHIFRGRVGEGALAYLGTTQETRYTDPDAQPGVAYEYAIVAVDSAGNESPVLTKVRITPAP
jgi:hypothetical protein